MLIVIRSATGVLSVIDGWSEEFAQPQQDTRQVRN